MLSKLLFRHLFRPVKATLPAGIRVYAIGDVHGRSDLLRELLVQIDVDAAQRPYAKTQLIFLGDLVDRGPDSRGVIDIVSTIRSSEYLVRGLLGNHDELFLSAALGNAKAIRHLLRIGGKPTIESYGITGEEYQAADFEALASLLGSRVPESHLLLLKSFEDWIEIGDYVFVHAGIRPGVPIREQRPSDLRWIREEFLKSRLDHGKIIVHGHSIKDRPDVRTNRIGIDTGAYETGRLTAIGIEGCERWFLST